MRVLVLLLVLVLQVLWKVLEAGEELQEDHYKLAVLEGLEHREAHAGWRWAEVPKCRRTLVQLLVLAALQ